MVHLRPQTPQEQSLAKPETHLLIILSLVCKYDIKEVHGNYTNPVFSKKVHGQKRPWKVDKCRKSSPYIIVSKYWQHPVHRSSLSPSVKHLNANKYKWHTASVRLPDVNYISMHNSCKYPNQSRGHQDESHCLSHRFRCLFLLFNIFGIDWNRNIIITVIADHFSHAQGRWPVYFSFTNWKSDQIATWLPQLHIIMSIIAVLAIEIYLNYHHLLTHAIIPILPSGCKSNQTVDLCKSFNPAYFFSLN